MIVTDSSFDQVIKENKVILVDFWAEWCGPCRMIAPIIEELSKDFEGKALIGKVDVDLNNEISAKYGIRNIPTILFLKNGEVVDKQVGAVQKSVLADKLNKLI